MPSTVSVVLEIGSKRAFASALEWPGWSRSGRDVPAALETLVAYGPRYAAALAGRAPGPSLPRSTAELKVAERLPGNATTDFGAPGVAAAAEARSVTAKDLGRLETILRACWATFDATADASAHVRLRGGPRGGGRDLPAIRAHVMDAESAYLTKLGGRAAKGATVEGIRDAFIEALGARARGEIADTGPRGGARWSPRYAARRSAWHTLDHTWEIEDRSAE